MVALPGISRNRLWKRLFPISFFTGLFLLGIWLLYDATPWGIGIRHDSIMYLSAARNLASKGCLCWSGSGNELKPLIHFGPLYPTLIFLVDIFAVDFEVSARFLAAIFYSLNVILPVLIVFIITRRLWVSALSSLLFLSSPILLEVHDGAMSEPIFLFLFLATILSLSFYHRERRLSLLSLSGGLASLAMLSRYAGASVVVAGILSIFVSKEDDWRRKFRDTFIFAAIGFLPSFLWALRNYFLTGSLTNRTFSVHTIGIEQLRKMLDVMTAWFSPIKTSHWIEGGVLILFLSIAALAFWMLSRAREVDREVAGWLGLILTIFIVVYLAFLVISRSYFDATIPFDDRLLSPVYVSVLAMIGLITSILLSLPRIRWMAVPAILVIAFWATSYAWIERQDTVREMKTEGIGFSCKEWQESSLMTWIDTLPAGTTIYSNEALAIQLLTDRPAYQTPMKYDGVIEKIREDYPAQLKRMQTDLWKPDSYLIFINPVRGIDPSTINSAYLEGLQEVFETEDGIVFEAVK